MRPLARGSALACISLLAAGCTESSKAPASPGPETGAVMPAPTASAAGTCASAGPVLSALTTEDGVSLAADLYTTGSSRGPAVVLLHMIPPSNNRQNFPAAFIDAVVKRGVSVLNVDRRGAGGSGGTATEAYTGSKGALDAKAAVAFLRGHACAFDEDRIGIVGASNGTTTMVDYAVSAAKPPRLLVYLTGGGYTENQTKLRDHRGALEAIPSLFVFSTAESEWSKGFASGAPAAWRFDEYPKGAHGTGMFGAEPTSVDKVADFVAASLTPSK